MRRHLPLALLPLVGGLAACVAAPEPRTPPPVENTVAAAPEDPQTPPEQIAPPPEAARVAEPARPLPPSDAQRRLDAALAAWLQSHATQRIYVAVDKPMYQPGETIWFAGFVAQSATFAAAPGGGLTYTLVSPRGAQVAARRVLIDARGVAANDIPLPDDVAGGEYTLRAQSDAGAVDERKVIVASYEAPRLKKTLELTKKAYGPGDTVVAAVSVARGTGEPLAGRQLIAVATVDGAEVARLPVTTDGAGNAAVRFTLPARIERGDALLTVSAEDGGVTESIGCSSRFAAA